MERSWPTFEYDLSMRLTIRAYVASPYGRSGEQRRNRPGPPWRSYYALNPRTQSSSDSGVCKNAEALKASTLVVRGPHWAITPTIPASPALSTAEKDVGVDGQFLPKNKSARGAMTDERVTTNVAAAFLILNVELAGLRITNTSHF